MPDLQAPLPMRAGPHQSGITDPQWPLDPPDGAPPAEYERDRAGRVDRQEDLALVFADVDARPREALREVLVAVSRFARKEMDRPPARDLQAGAAPPSTYRVTVTVAFGASLFTTAQQDDRWGLAHLRPRQLRRMPRFAGDGAGFAAAANDLLFVIASDHPYVNAAIARSIAHGYVDPRLRVTRMEQGFARPDRREFLRFDDGIDNLRNRHERKELDELVYVQAGDDEPAWCRGGSYLVYRKIREHLRTWEALSVAAQEGAIGRNKRTGEPLSRHRDSGDRLVPVFPDPTDPADGPLDAHIRKVQPRRPGADLLGIEDLERRFLRRPYPFLDTARGEPEFGLQFLAFMRNLEKQFEWPVQMWQTNPDFPTKGTGIDALYGLGVIENTVGGYFFCPPAPRSEEDFLGSGLFPAGGA